LKKTVGHGSFASRSRLKLENSIEQNKACNRQNEKDQCAAEKAAGGEKPDSHGNHQHSDQNGDVLRRGQEATIGLLVLGIIHRRADFDWTRMVFAHAISPS